VIADVAGEFGAVEIRLRWMGLLARDAAAMTGLTELRAFGVVDVVGHAATDSAS